MSYGFVYLLSNPAMPGIYKIGMTDRAPMQRVDELSRSTSVPCDFNLICYAECDGAIEVEKKLHEQFAPFRLNPCREFFRLGHESLWAVIEELQSNSLNFCDCDYGYEYAIAKHEELKQEKIGHFFSQEADPFHAQAIRGFE